MPSKWLKIPLGLSVLGLIGLLSLTAYLGFDRTKQIVQGSVSRILPTAFSDTFENEKLKALLLEDLPALKKTTSELEKANLIRNFVFQKSNLGPSNVSHPISIETYESFKQGKIQLYCGGLSVVFLTLAQSVGLEGRFIGFATENAFAKKDQNTHVAVEVKINGKWILQDPTFNIRWNYQGKPIDTLELRKLFQNKQKPIHTTDGFPVSDKRAIKNHNIGFDELTEVVWLSEFDTDGINPRVRYITKAAPYPISHYYKNDPFTQVEEESISTETPTIEWDFSGQVPDNFITSSFASVSSSKNNKTTTLTTDTSVRTQLKTTWTSLKAGQYVLKIKGKIKKGGLYAYVSIKNPSSQTPLQKFWWGQFTDLQNKILPIPIHLKEDTEIKIHFGNWAVEKATSQWIFEKMEIWKTSQ